MKNRIHRGIPYMNYWDTFIRPKLNRVWRISSEKKERRMIIRKWSRKWYLQSATIIYSLREEYKENSLKERLIYHMWEWTESWRGVGCKEEGCIRNQCERRRKRIGLRWKAIVSVSNDAKRRFLLYDKSGSNLFTTTNYVYALLNVDSIFCTASFQGQNLSLCGMSSDTGANIIG